MSSNPTGKKIVTVFGATGRQGGGAVRYLTADGTFHVRAVTRNPDSDAAKAVAQLGAEIVKADLNDKDSLVAALKGAYGVFGVTDFWQPDTGPREEIQGKLLVDAAKETGIRHFVWSTLEHSDLNVVHIETKANVDDYLKASGVPRTSLYSSFFLDNVGHYPFNLHKQADGTLLLDLVPFVTDGVLPAIAGSDCGVLAGIALTNPEKYLGKDVYAATDFITPRRMAQEFSEYLGETVHVKEFSMKEFDRLWEEVAPEERPCLVPAASAEMWTMVKWFYKYGQPGQTPRNVAETLAILPNPTTFRKVLEEVGKEALLPK